MSNIGTNRSDSRAIDVLRTYVSGQAEIGYADFEPGPDITDVILATFPKSGSTWISYLLHQIRSEGDEEFGDIKDAVIDITPGHWDPKLNPFQIEQSFFPRTFKTHGSYLRCPKGGRYIYVARNPADVLWSLYYFVHDLFALGDRVPLEEFYMHYFVDRFKTGHDIGNIWDHLLGWFPHRQDSNALWIHYEDILEDREACLDTIARFMGVKLTDHLRKLVMARSTIEHVRTVSSRLNPSQQNRTGRVTLTFGPEMVAYAKHMRFGKVRKGKTGDGCDNLPPDILTKLDDEWRHRILPALGYADYAEMRHECSLLNRHKG